MNSNHIETLVLHAGIEPDPTTGAIMTPIFQTSTYVQAAPGDHKGYEYARTQNPTRDVLQKNLAALEGTKHGLCFSTGMGAVDACAKLLQPGDEVVSTNDLYGGTYRLFTKIFAQYGIKFHFVDMSDESAVRAVMNKNTKMVWVETPTNPLLRIIDIELMIQIGHEFGSIVVVDNTFASPYLQNPAKMGADIVMHSATKFLSGHGVVIGGVLVDGGTFDWQAARDTTLDAFLRMCAVFVQKRRDRFCPDSQQACVRHFQGRQIGLQSKQVGKIVRVLRRPVGQGPVQPVLKVKFSEQSRQIFNVRSAD